MCVAEAPLEIAQKEIFQRLGEILVSGSQVDQHCKRGASKTSISGSLRERNAKFRGPARLAQHNQVRRFANSTSSTSPATVCCCPRTLRRCTSGAGSWASCWARALRQVQLMLVVYSICWLQILLSLQRMSLLQGFVDAADPQEAIQ